MRKRTKIVCTIGPSSEKKTVLQRMMRAGMNAARLNFSHGTYRNHALLLKNIRSAAKAAGVVITVIQDLQGPRIRLGELAQKTVWKKGQQVTLSGDLRDGAVVPVNYPRLHKDLAAGHRILLEDGKKELKVTGVSGKRVVCVVVRGGEVASRKGMNFPDSTMSIDPITEKDKRDLAFGLKQDVDYVVMSFVSEARQLRRLRRMMGRQGSRTGIIAKIEVAQALSNIENIIREADGIMIGRGDLALEIDYAQVPLWQKRIIALCRRHAKPVIVATQMMESMMKGKGAMPSRSDVSDVANAVIDHADAVMTSGETAVGDNPVATVRTMAHIIEETEKSSFDDVLLSTFKTTDFGVMVRRYAENKKYKAIVVEDSPPEAVRLLSRARIELPLFVKTDNKDVLRRFALLWGVMHELKPRIPPKALHMRGGKIVD